MMKMRENPYDEEFINPNRNFDTLMMELSDRIQKLRLDTIHVNDIELKGIAEQMYTDLRIKYFNLMAKDLELQKLYEGVEDDQTQE